MTELLEVIGAGVVIFFGWRLFLTIVGQVAPIEFTAVAFTREEFKRNGVDWRTLPEPLLTAIAHKAIGCASLFGPTDRSEMARHIKFFVRVMCGYGQWAADSPEAEVARSIYKRAFEIGSARMRQLYGDDPPRFDPM
jgi:hypothetical protein